MALVWALLLALLAACGPSSTTPPVTVPPSASPTPADTATPPPSTTPAWRLTEAPVATPRPSATPVPPPEPAQGYWIRSGTAEGLCSDAPRLIGYDASRQRAYVGGDGSAVCYWGYFGLERWPRDDPSPLLDFQQWMSVTVPYLDRVTAGANFDLAHPNRRADLPSTQNAVYAMPSFVGTNGQCVMDQEGQWHHYGPAEGLPFADIRGYAIGQYNVEWFMSEDSVSSLGLQPQEMSISLPQFVGQANARPTALHASHWVDSGVWVGTNHYGLLYILPLEQQVVRYTTADGLPSNEVRSVQACGPRCAWAATAAGVAHWDGSRWRAYTTADGLPSDDVRGVSIGAYYHQDGWTWAATAAGPALFQQGAERWQDFPDFPVGLEVTDVLYGIFSTPGQGLLRFVPGELRPGSLIHFSTADGLPDDRITALAATPSGILVGTPSGAAEWRNAEWVPITSAVVNDAHGISIATDEGLWLWNGTDWAQVNQERILHVAEGLWYATPERVCRWVQGEAECPTTQQGRPLQGVQALYAHPGLEMVVALDGAGEQWLYDPATAYFVPYNMDFMPQVVNDVLVTDDVWYFATPRGLYFSPRQERYPVVYSDWKLAGGWPLDIRQLAWDEQLSGGEAQGEIWAVTAQGAFLHRPFDPHSPGPAWIYVPGLPSDDLNAVQPVPYGGGDVWLGTAGSGVFYWQIAP